jgi:hypothetical protein
VGISAKFDQFEDRIKLFVDSGDNTCRPFWFKRFQWINLIFSLALLRQAKPNVIPNLSEKKVSSKNKNSPKKLSELPAFFVKDVRVRLVKNKFKLIISSVEASPVVLTMNNEDLGLLSDMLLDLAEKARWDVAAGLDRINVEQKSHIAIRDIMKKKD